MNKLIEKYISKEDIGTLGTCERQAHKNHYFEYFGQNLWVTLSYFFAENAGGHKSPQSLKSLVSVTLWYLPVSPVLLYSSDGFTPKHSNCKQILACGF